MRSRFSILSLGVSMLVLPTALAQLPPQALPLQRSSPLDTLTAPPSQKPQKAGELKLVAQPGVTFQQSTAVETAPIKPKTRVFEVADLVHAPLQIPGAATLENSKGTTAHALMKWIVAMTAPESWELGGGAGTIEFIAASDSLCITNVPNVLVEVTNTLERLRRLRSQHVLVEVQIVSVPAGFGEKAGWSSASETGKPKPKYYTPEELKKAVAEIKTDCRTTIITSPKMTCVDGQVGTFRVGQVVDVAESTHSAAGVVAVANKSVEIGTMLQCTPTIAINGKSVQFKMGTVHTCLSNSDTQTIRDTSTTVLASGHSAILYLGQQSVQERVETKVPVLSEIPYLNRLFRNTGIGKTQQDLYQIVTVRILKPEGTAQATRVDGCCPVK
jgi:type II secretory pathway component GspD/PulD (secretin)